MLKVIASNQTYIVIFYHPIVLVSFGFRLVVLVIRIGHFWNFTDAL